VGPGGRNWRRQECNGFGRVLGRNSGRAENGFWRPAPRRRYGGGRAWRKVGRFKALNRNGIGGGSNLEKEGMWRTFEDFERPRIRGREGWMGGRREDKNHGRRKQVLWDGGGCLSGRGCRCECPRECVIQCGEKMG
jgi:hypothetical protein